MSVEIPRNPDEEYLSGEIWMEKKQDGTYSLRFRSVEMINLMMELLNIGRPKTDLIQETDSLKQGLTEQYAKQIIDRVRALKAQKIEERLVVIAQKRADEESRKNVTAPESRWSLAALRRHLTRS